MLYARNLPIENERLFKLHHYHHVTSLDRPLPAEDNPRYSACRNPPATRSRADSRLSKISNSIGDIAVEGQS
jgi:hypothetical protein